MPRDPVTGVYTRPSNTFSEPAVGTLIEPADATALFDDQDTEGFNDLPAQLISGDFATLDVSNSGLTKGVDVAQTVTGSTGGNYQANRFRITSDNAATAGGILANVLISDTFGGSTVDGGRQGLQIYNIMSTTTNAANSFPVYTAATLVMDVRANDNGTGITAKGDAITLNTSQISASGATFWNSMQSIQADVYTPAGISVKYRGGITVCEEGSAVQGSTWDAAFGVSALGASVGFNTAFLIGNMRGAAPMATTATLIATTGSATVTKGIDFSSYTFTGNQYTGPQNTVTIDNRGNTNLGITSPASGSSIGLTLNGAAAGTAAGTGITGLGAGAAIWRVGNTSAVLGAGAYDPTLMLYSTTNAYRFSGLTAGLFTSSANGTVSVTAPGTGVLTALGVNVGSAGAFVIFNGALGTPSSGTLTSATGLPISTGLTGAGTGVLTALAVNVGSAGAFVTFNGALGTPSSGTVTNLTGTASININGTVGATTPAAGTFTAAIANSFVPNSSTVPTNGFYLPAANTVGWAINSAAEMQLTSTALSPAADGGNSLGTTAQGWQNLFGATGFVFNIANGNWVATHTSGILTVGTGDLRVTTAGSNSASAVTVGGTQTLTNKTIDGASNTLTSLNATQLTSGTVPVARIPSASAQVTPANPTGTSNTTGLMMGLGSTCTITPGWSGRVRISWEGNSNSSTTNSGFTILRFGTGTAPTNGAAATGTIVGATGGVFHANPSLAVNYLWARSGVVTGLTPGTAYWFDLQLGTNIAGTAALQNLAFSADEF